MIPMRALGCLAIILGLGEPGVGRGAELPQPAAPRLLEPFDYRGVTLEPGLLQRQVEEVRRFYLAIPDDDLLKGFRARAGRPAPGRDLGGWYSGDVFLVFGQIVSGLARLHAGTGDPACRDKANRLIAEWAKCIEPDGYFYASRKPNAPHYIYDKMLWGLLDAYRYCASPEALGALSRITDWATGHLDRSRRVNDTATEWYTLSENLYRAYLATGDAKYRQFAEVWEYHDYWDVYARNGNLFAPRPEGAGASVFHAYSHVNTLGGAAAAYLVKGQSAYLDTIKNAYRYLQAEQCFATGGWGPDEEILPRERLLQKLQETHNTFETQCGCWAAFKLAKYLIAFTGDATYGDWIERLVYNGLSASIPMTTNGHVFYYSDYCLHGGAKRNTDFGWSCCTGTRPQAVADYHDLVYFHDDQNLCVNLFAPSTVRWSRAAGTVTVTQATRFPEDGEVDFRINLSKPTGFGIKFRVPGWVASPLIATVNLPLRRPGGLAHGATAAIAETPLLPGRGSSMSFTNLVLEPGHWASLHRTWHDGDIVRLWLDMKLWASPFAPPQASPAAVLYGPVVLAFQTPRPRILRSLDPADPKLTPGDPRGPLSFSRWFAASRQDAPVKVEAKPFYSLAAGERYYIYLDPRLGTRISYRDVQFTGHWNDAGVHRFSNEVGATAQCQFEGTGIRWLGWRYNDAGRAEVTIDGRVIGSVDQYGPGRDLPFDWSYRGLAPGQHVLRLRLLPDKPPASTDRYLNVRGFEVED